jgi:hypothetical protein
MPTRQVRQNGWYEPMNSSSFVLCNRLSFMWVGGRIDTANVGWYCCAGRAAPPAPPYVQCTNETTRILHCQASTCPLPIHPPSYPSFPKVYSLKESNSTNPASKARINTPPKAGVSPQRVACHYVRLRQPPPPRSFYLYSW